MESSSYKTSEWLISWKGVREEKTNKKEKADTELTVGNRFGWVTILIKSD